MTVSARKITAFAKLVAGLADTPNLGSTTLLKQWFDSSPEELRVAVNGLIDDLIATAAGASGTEQIGSAPISGVAGSTAYAQLSDLKSQLNGVVLGQIPPDLLANGLTRQAIINGNFDIWQRGTSFAIGAGSPYTADGWQCYRGSIVAGMTVSRQDGSAIYGSKYCLRAQRDSGNAAINTLNVAQPMESVDSQKFRGKKATLSFYARCGANYSAASSFLNVLLATGTGTDQSVTGSITGYSNVINSNVVLTTAWQKFSLTVPAVFADTVNQLFALFNYTPVGTAGANDYFEIDQVQVNEGTQPLPFQLRSYEEELRKCQRTCFVLIDDINSQALIGYGFGASTTIALIGVNLPIQMRTQPTISANATDFNLQDGVTATTLTAISIQPGQNGRNALTIRATVAAGLTQFRPYSLTAVAINKLLIFDASI